MTDRTNSPPIIVATAPIDAYATAKFSALGDIVVAPDLKEETLVGLMNDRVVAIVVRGAAPITARVIAAAPELKVIGRTGVGYDTVDIAAATARAIPVVYTPGAGARAVAEATFAFMLGLCKRVAHWDRELKAGNWKARYGLQGGDLDGKVLGIVGLGRIGRLVARMAQPFDMTVIAADPYLTDAEVAAHGARRVDLDTLMRQADFITLHCPMNQETRGLVGAAELAKVKPGAYLVNLARGGVIESLDVVEDALADGRLAGAALDVFEPSPPDTAHPIFKRENLLTSPHSMATSDGAMTRIFRSMTDDMTAFLAGGTPQFVVNPEVLKR